MISKRKIIKKIKNLFGISLEPSEYYAQIIVKEARILAEE